MYLSFFISGYVHRAVNFVVQRHKTLSARRRIVGISLCVFALLSSRSLLAATCQYALIDDWNSGFKAEISIINTSANPIDDWEVSWRWSDNSTFSSGWLADFQCQGSECAARPPGWSQSIPPQDTYTFGFIANKAVAGVPADAQIAVEGDICEAVIAPIDVTWRLDASQSSVDYISTKNSHIAEVNNFSGNEQGTPALEGSIDKEGVAVLAIDLNDVQTGVDIRNERMANYVFETEFLPRAFITTGVDLNVLSEMAVGDTYIDQLQSALIIHGVRQDVVADVLVVKHSPDHISVSTRQPMLIDSKDFDMANGLAILQTIANLSSIGQVVPVYFRLHYVKNTNAEIVPVAMAETPSAPDSLEGEFDESTAIAQLSWQDTSDNESGFILRRKSIGGFWQTVTNLLANITAHTESLPNEGEYDYKVIAINDGVPSAPSNEVRIDVSEGDPLARGEALYGELCAGCHGPAGGGIGNFPPINTPRPVGPMIELIAATMPFGNASACGQACAEDIATYIQTLWVSEIACDRSVSPINYGARQLKILTQSEYQRSVEDLIGLDFDAATGLSADAKVGLFRNNTHAALVASSYSNYLIVAEEIAEWSAQQNFFPALSCEAIDSACANSYLNELAPRIFRRPLAQDEIDIYEPMVNGSLTEGDIHEGIKMAMASMLSSPQFIYRHELGTLNPDNSTIDVDAFELTSYEMATFLAYTFTGSTPDEVLLAAAAKDELRNDAGILNQALRLLEDARAERVLGDFVGSWLGTENLTASAKDTQAWPGFLDLAASMQAEINQMFASVMLDPQEQFSSLYTANYTFVNQVLADHYGIAGVFDSELEPVATTNRGGILANGAFMSRWGEGLETSPVLRSVRVRRRMLCQDQPAPPAGTFAAREAKLAELSDLLKDPTTTNRLKYHRLTEDEPCTNCHLKYINPLGFGMEDFDTTGRFRTTDLNGNVIDAVGALYAPNDYNNVEEVEPFEGTRELGQVLASLPSAQACIPKQIFRFVMGVGHDGIDANNPSGPDLSDDEKIGYACAIEQLTESMMNESPRAMLENFGLLDAVRYRKAWSREQ